jgi:hypothetical protein
MYACMYTLCIVRKHYFVRAHMHTCVTIYNQFQLSVMKREPCFVEREILQFIICIAASISVKVDFGIEFNIKCKST